MQALRLRREGVAWSDLGSEVVILDLRSSTYYSVRDTGAFLVNLLMTGASVPVLVERLLTSYEISEEAARGDVEEFVKELTRRDLVEPAEPTDA